MINVKTLRALGDVARAFESMAPAMEQLGTALTDLSAASRKAPTRPARQAPVQATIVRDDQQGGK